ncbi:MAG: 4a-hydroxytetrahydrobiopterin dehydratase [bacterium]|nr:4a-hydroxytetrahydrobiopterin dehydratase [bacterium]
MALLKNDEIEDGLSVHPEWKWIGDSITRTYGFPSFRASLAFVDFVGELAEARDHHPDIDIRYSKVTLILSTHAAGGLTAKDFDLVGLIDGRG